MKIKDLIQVLIETQKQINRSLKDLNENLVNKNNEINSKIISIDKSLSAIQTNVYNKEETVKIINKEMDYNKRLEKAKKDFPELLELIDCISTSYAKMDKYGILDTAEMFSASYEIKKKIN